MRRALPAVLAVLALGSGVRAQAYASQFALFSHPLSPGPPIATFNGSTFAFTPNPMGGNADFDDTISTSALSHPGAFLSLGPLTGATMGVDVYHWAFQGAFSFQIVDAIGADLLSGVFGEAHLDSSGALSANLDICEVTYTSGLYWSALLADFPATGTLGSINISFSGLNHGGFGLLGANPTTGAFDVGGNGVLGGMVANFVSAPGICPNQAGAAAPEPGSLALLGVGLLATRRRRRTDGRAALWSERLAVLRQPRRQG